MTAEFMMLMPVLVLGVSLTLGAVSLGFERLELQTMSWSMARADALGLELPELEGATYTIERIERISCVHLLKSNPLPIRAKSCQLILGY
ncbi:hypothetical protein [Candidatus Aquiluna sp. UB-MaderosW2red]|uniref:hypothetical protein n=1 Tax=Candidatus Aquiluna sp. UB-MaderosW2red TaxID=1855377 RepID=UPI000875BF89|nr:hypothetical protein [Candidatus Aquiluna sp. UB-MaderosW2red]SCX14670.1 hypothetical protein SAMN05216534_1556 [Candidatus Aquiluna sp. UB-MaderosW2red]